MKVSDFRRAMRPKKYLTRDFVVYQDPKRLEARSEMQAGGVVEREGFSKGSPFGNRPKPALDRLSDALLNAHAKDDIRHLLINSGVGNFSELDRANLSNILLTDENAMQYVSKNSGLSTEDILNLIDDRDAYFELEGASKRAKLGAETLFGDERKFYQDAEQWIMENAKRYDDPAKFKKAFKRTFPKNNYLLNAINSKKTTPIMTQFSDDFKREIFGTGEGRSPGGKVVSGKATKDISRIGTNSSVLDDVFRVAIYNFNPTVRNKIRNEFMSIIPKETSVSDKQALSTKKNLEKNKLLKQFGLDKKIKGPISRLILKDLGENLFNSISEFRKPFQTVESSLIYLKDKVNPKYREAFKETLQAVRYAKKSLWNDAKKQLNIAQNINFDHKIPKALIDAGYADEINYIKLTPVTSDFNTKIKNVEFDRPLIKLTKKYELASPNEKPKIFKKIQSLKDSFNKKTKGYLDDIIITEKKGKLTFDSKVKPLTKKTNVVSELSKNLFQDLDVDPETREILNKLNNKLAMNPFDAEGLFKDEIAKMKRIGTPAAKFIGGALGGLIAEIGFEAAFAIPAYSRGVDFDEILSNTIFGLVGFGKTRLEKVVEESGFDPDVVKYADLVNRKKQFQKDVGFLEYFGKPGVKTGYAEIFSPEEIRSKNLEKRIVENAQIFNKELDKLNKGSPQQQAYEKAEDKLKERYEKQSEEEISRKVLKETGKKFTDFVTEEDRRLEERMNELERLGFKEGGFGKMGRRSFIKLAVGIAAIIGGLRGGVKQLKTPIAKKVLKDAPQGTPDWFAPLIEKITKEGIDISDKAATIERQTVKELKTPDGTYTVTETPDTGEIIVSVDTGAGVNDLPVDFTMTPNRITGVADDGTPITEFGEFNIVESRVEGRLVSPDDYDIDLEEYVTSDLDDAASDWHSVEKFATGKTDEIAQKKKQDGKEFIEAFPNEDLANRYGDYDPPDPNDY